MAKNALLASLVIIFVTSAVAMSFQVQVEDQTNHSFKNLDYQEKVETTQQINGTVENIGSIGCEYRLKAEFQQNNDTFTRYSSPSPLFQGSNADLQLYYVPMNYTGEVETSLYLDYCDQEEHLEDFSFNVTENTVTEQISESRTKRVSETSATVETETEEGLLVPEEAPVYWKTGASPIQDSEATLEYRAPIFNDNEVLKYTVVEDGEVVGTTEVSLQEEPIIAEQLYEHRFEIVASLLGLSLLANILMYIRRKKDHSED